MVGVDLTQYIGKEMFQSLFYWNDLMVSVKAFSPRFYNQSFNPCSIGMTLWCQKIRRQSAQILNVSILVLLE